jgi:hypothetical protein
MDRLVKKPELLHTRRHWTSSASGSHAVTKRYVVKPSGYIFRWHGCSTTGVKAEPKRSGN